MRKATACLIVMCGVLGYSVSGDIPDDFRKQKVTQARIAGLALAIEDLQLNGLQSVPSLAELVEVLQLPGERVVDGWGNPLYFYSTGDGYLLASFGRDGRPDPQIAPPGGPTKDRDYDADIVFVNGEWAQFSWGTSP